MAFLDRLNDIAKNIGDKTNDAIETTRLNSKIRSEQEAAAGDLQKIGEHYYNLFVVGGEAAPEVLEFCQSAKAHYDAAAEGQAEIERIRRETEAPAAPAAAAPSASAPAASAPAAAGMACPSCGASNAPGTKFCQSCGAKLETPPPDEREQKTCPNCGSAMEPGVKFCPQCGAKVE